MEFTSAGSGRCVLFPGESVDMAVNTSSKVLSAEGIPTLGTALFGLPQAIACSQAGMLYISPYFNGGSTSACDFCSWLTVPCRDTSARRSFPLAGCRRPRHATPHERSRVPDPRDVPKAVQGDGSRAASAEERQVRVESNMLPKERARMLTGRAASSPPRRPWPPAN